MIARDHDGDGALVIEAERAVRHPDFYNAGNDMGRWIGESEHPDFVGPPNYEEYEVWPHRIGVYYNEFVWEDHVTIVRETQILLAVEVDGDWFIPIEVPWLVQPKPRLTLQTPCTPQQT